MIKEAISRLINGERIPYEMVENAMDEFINNNCSDVEMSSFLTALAIRGTDVNDVVAFSKSMKKNCIRFPSKVKVFEIGGTGGDKSNSFNISTMSSIVVASAGIETVKHGNRSSTCKCGSADFIEAAGVRIDIAPKQAAAVLEKIGISYLFAQQYHTCMKRVSTIRKLLPFPTVFNVLGPLTNPARVNKKLLGVYDEKLVVPLAKALKSLGVEKGMVVYGKDGFDEISISAPTLVCEFNDDSFFNYEIHPEDYGMMSYNRNDIIGGNPSENVSTMFRILEGERGAPRDAVLLNAGTAIHIVKGISINEGIRMAEDLIDSGAVLNKLNEWRILTKAPFN